MPYATLNGLKINYVAQGNGPPPIMLAPGGYDSTIESWSTRGVWKDMRPLDALKNDFNMIAYDRREADSTSSAHALRELVPGSVLSPLMPPQQNAATVTAWIRDSVAAAKVV